MAKNITNTKSNTLISGTSGNDSIKNGSGYDNKGGNRVTINGGAGNDYIDNWYSSNVSLVGGADNDHISNYSGEKATISGGAGADYIWNGYDSDETSINGGNDDDRIYNHAEEVTITGGKGNDRIYLKDDSSETLIKYSSGDGSDIINGFNSTSTLSVSGSYSTQVSGYDVLVKSGSSTITLKNVYATADKIRINGKSTALERKTIKLTSDNNDVDIFRDSISVVGSAQGDWIGNYGEHVTIDAGKGDDYISILEDDNTITGGKGNDTIYFGYDASDNLVKYSNGDGNDTISGFNSTSTLSVSGSYSTQVSGYDVLVKSGSSTITLKNVYASADKININGKSTTLERKTIKLTSDNNDVDIFRDSISVVGSAQGDWIYNYGDKVTINSGKGEDCVSNSDGDNVIINTGSGADYINNYADDVTITGGTGNDTIYIGYDAEKNVINYSSGDGNDSIRGFNATSTLNIAGSYSTKKSGSDIIVTVGKGKITLQGAARLSKLNIKKTSGDSSSSGGDSSSSTTKTVTNSTKSPVTVSSSVKNIISASRTKSVKITGNSLANSIVGGSKNDILYGKAGNDTIRGGKGSDKIYGGAGNDYIYGGDGNDTLKGVKGNDKLWGNDDDNVFIYENGDGKDTIYGFDDDDMLKITGSFFASYNSSKKEIYFKVGNTSNAITLKNYDTSTFNVNGSNYRISGSKLVKR